MRAPSRRSVSVHTVFPSGALCVAAMEVFDEVQGMTAPDWVHRFDTVIGEDLEDKRSYALRVWGRDGVRELPI